MASKEITQPQADLLRSLRQGATLIWPKRATRPLIKANGCSVASYASAATVSALVNAGYIRRGERRDRFDNAMYEVTPEAPAT